MKYEENGDEEDLSELSLEPLIQQTKEENATNNKTKALKVTFDIDKAMHNVELDPGLPTYRNGKVELSWSSDTIQEWQGVGTN